MRWAELCLLIGILYTLVIEPLMDHISYQASNKYVVPDGSVLQQSANQTVGDEPNIYQSELHRLFRAVAFPKAYATDPDSICPVQSIPCVECRSDHHPHCRDPFNRSLLNFNDIPYKLCNGYCVKWIRAPLSPHDQYGDLYIRTCSSNINVRFQISPVCFHESFSENHILCFCNRPKCNSQALLRPSFVLTGLFLVVVTHLTIKLEIS